MKTFRPFFLGGLLSIITISNRLPKIPLLLALATFSKRIN